MPRPAAPQGGEEGRTRRLYLVSRTPKENQLATTHPAEAEGNSQITEIQVSAPPEVAEQEGFDTMVKEVYSQLKANPAKGTDSIVSVPPAAKTRVPGEPAKGNPLFKREEPPKPASQQAASSDLKPPELPSLESQPKPEDSQNRDLFSELSRVSEAAEQPSGKSSTRTGQVKFVEIPREKGMGCPNCREQTTRVVFCPYCGSGMCANCSPNIKPDGDFFVYTCPRCGEEVNVSRKN